MCMRDKLPELLGVHLQLNHIPKTLPSLLDKRQNPSFRLPNSGDAPTIPQRPQHRFSTVNLLWHNDPDINTLLPLDSSSEEQPQRYESLERKSFSRDVKGWT